MSGAAFEGLPRTAPDSGSYVAGSNGYEAKLIDAIAGPYLDDRGLEGHDAWLLMSSILKKLPREPEEGFDADTVLDGIISRVGASGEEGHFGGLGQALDHVVQHFYGWGLNGFHVDLSSLPLMPQDFGSGLHGKTSRPLELTCTSDELCGFGFNSSYCRFTYIGSLIYGGGSGLAHSELTLQGSITNGVVGFKSRSTIFRVRELGYIHCGEITDCGFYVTEQVSECQLACFLEDHWQPFTEDRNRLYVPAGGGKWKRIIPEWKLDWNEVPQR